MVRGVQRLEPDYTKLSRAVVEITKELQQAADLGITVEELRRLRQSAKGDL